jgi:hypothetical protein
LAPVPKPAVPASRPASTLTSSPRQPGTGSRPPPKPGSGPGRAAGSTRAELRPRTDPRLAARHGGAVPGPLTRSPLPKTSQGRTHLRTAGPPGPAGRGTPSPAGWSQSRGPPCPRAHAVKRRKVRGPPARAVPRLQLPPPAVCSHSGLSDCRHPAEEGSSGRDLETLRPQAPTPSNHLLPNRSSAGVAWVVVGADWLCRPPPRPISDRITWKHKTWLRLLVVELSAGSKPPRPAEGRRRESCVAAAESACAGRQCPFGPASRFRLARETGEQSEVSRVVLEEESAAAEWGMKRPDMAPCEPKPSSKRLELGSWEKPVNTVSR